MFEIGEKVVCINNGEMRIEKYILPPNDKLYLYRVYNIIQYIKGEDCISLDECGYNNYFDIRRFISLSEYRRKKIIKIKNKIKNGCI